VSVRPLLVVQHEDDCPPAWFGEWLGQAGCALDVRRPYAGAELPASLSGHAGMLVLGGPMGAYDDAEFPWLPGTKALVREAAATGVPTFAICLGHQLAAVALGGTVVVNPRGQQLGLTPLGWLPAARGDRLFARAGLPLRGVQWNDDVVTALPPGAEVLARTPADEIQAARLAPTVWGVQLHPEADDGVVAPWAEPDRGRHPEGVVEAALARIAEARDELSKAWRPLATAFAELVLERDAAVRRVRRGRTTPSA
jgi:GMP synthase (glutamine-hydrolysing)